MNEVLKTAKGSKIERCKKYGVGKAMRGSIYLYKDYAPELFAHDLDLWTHAQFVLNCVHPDFQYNCIRYNTFNSDICFQEVPDFDTAREPVVGKYVTVDYAGGCTPVRNSKAILHHKWLWVKDDYKGFNVEESWNWSKKWLSLLKETAIGTNIDIWKEQLTRYGLE